MEYLLHIEGSLVAIGLENNKIEEFEICTLKVIEINQSNSMLINLKCTCSCLQCHSQPLQFQIRDQLIR